MVTIEQVAKWVRKNAFLRSQFVQEGGNSRQAGLPVLLDDDGHIDASMINDADIGTLTTPTIGDFTNATHDHADAAGGGQLTVASLSDQGSWTAASLGTGWQNLGGGYDSAQYRKFGYFVVLKGAVLRASGTVTTIFTLPSGFRPPGKQEFLIAGSGDLALVDVSSAGSVILTQGNPDSSLFLDGILFSIV